MQEFDDLRVAVSAALQKIQAAKEAQALLAAEQAAHAVTREALAAVQTDLAKTKSEAAAMKTELTTALEA